MDPILSEITSRMTREEKLALVAELKAAIADEMASDALAGADGRAGACPRCGCGRSVRKGRGRSGDRRRRRRPGAARRRARGQLLRHRRQPRLRRRDRGAGGAPVGEGGRAGGRRHKRGERPALPAARVPGAHARRVHAQAAALPGLVLLARAVQARRARPQAAPVPPRGRRRVLLHEEDHPHRAPSRLQLVGTTDVNGGLT